MKKILLALLLLSGASNAWACYDETLSDKANFDNCLAEAERGDAYVQTFVGVMYETGQGVTQDYKQAVKWYQKAAEQGYASAQYNLGNMYRSGLGVLQDYKQAVKWYQKAAEQGYASAQYNLGLMYVRGQGVTQDYVLAHMWWNIAGASGHSDAVTNRDSLAKDMTPAQIQEAQKLAREWMAKHE